MSFYEDMLVTRTKKEFGIKKLNLHVLWVLYFRLNSFRFNFNTKASREFNEIKFLSLIECLPKIDFVMNEKASV